MKTIKILTLMLSLSWVVFSCNDGIDPITRVNPGPDEQAPIVTITAPSGSVVNIPFTDTETDLTISFTATDDIEIESVVVKLNGTTLESYNSFKDYRRSSESIIREALAIGNHTLEVEVTDLSGKTTTATRSFELTNVYIPKYPGEVFYMPFEGNLYMDLISEEAASIVGSPSFATGKSGNAYAGATDSYITFPITDLGLTNDFSVSFWYKVNTVPERAGIFVIGPPGVNTRTSGIRVFREGGANTFKGNIGNGTADIWNDGGSISATNWVFITIVVSEGKFGIYANGTLLRAESSYTGNLSWANCEFISIGSGAPRFSEWNHLSDLSLIDEIRIFNRKLTQTEIQSMMAD